MGKSQTSWKLQVGKPQLQDRWAHLLYKHMNELSQATSSTAESPGTGRDLQESYNSGQRLVLCNHHRSHTPSDHGKRNKVCGTHHCLHSLHSPSLHLLKKLPVLEGNEKQDLSELWQQFPFLSLKKMYLCLHRRGYRSESTAILLNI